MAARLDAKQSCVEVSQRACMPREVDEFDSAETNGRQVIVSTMLKVRSHIEYLGMLLQTF